MLLLINLLQDRPTTTLVSFCALYIRWATTVLFTRSQLCHEKSLDYTMLSREHRIKQKVTFFCIIDTTL